MEKITENYCSYEVAKLLKEKGFEGEVSAFVEEDNTKYDYTLSGFIKAETLPCPTLQMAMKWLREVHELFVDISFVKDEHQEEKLFWFYAIFELSNNNAAHYNNVDEFTTYEEAVEAALKYSLENLI